MNWKVQLWTFTNFSKFHWLWPQLFNTFFSMPLTRHCKARVIGRRVAVGILRIAPFAVLIMISKKMVEWRHASIGGLGYPGTLAPQCKGQAERSASALRQKATVSGPLLSPSGTHRTLATRLVVPSSVCLLINCCHLMNPITLYIMLPLLDLPTAGTALSLLAKAIVDFIYLWLICNFKCALLKRSALQGYPRLLSPSMEMMMLSPCQSSVPLASPSTAFPYLDKPCPEATLLCQVGEHKVETRQAIYWLDMQCIPFKFWCTYTRSDLVWLYAVCCHLWTSYFLKFSLTNIIWYFF